MVKALERAQRAARKAQEAMYEGLCTVIDYGEVTDEKTKESYEGEVVALEGQPCRLSFEKSGSAVQTAAAAAISQGVKLFLPPEIQVKSNSKIVVTQNGVTKAYSASGEPAVYATHQEIPLELFRGWA